MFNLTDMIRPIIAIHVDDIANLIYAVRNSGDGKRIGLCFIIDFSKVCKESESDVMFWDQDAWGTPVTLTFFYYVIFNIYWTSLSSNSFLMGLTLYGCCLIGAESDTSTSCSLGVFTTDNVTKTA